MAALLSRSEHGLAFKELIGEGAYGKVFSAVWNGFEVAAKRIHEEFFRREYTQEKTDHYIGEFRKEWEILRKLDHPNIVKMHTVLFPSNKSPVIVMELMHCDLLNYIENSKSTPKVSPSKGLSIALGVAEGLEYLHGLTPPVVHRDLATKNILLTVDGQPKIADLGVAKVFAAGKEDFATVGPGTPVYSAPETYLNVRGNRAKYGVKVDIFSFGVVLLAINVGHEPVVLPVTHRKDDKKISEVERREKDLQQMEDARLKQLVIACLQEKSSNRPHASTIVKELQNIKVEQEEVECDQHVHFEKVDPQTSSDHHFKVLLIGNKGVGKSCLFELLEDPEFSIAEKTLNTTLSIHPGTHWFKYDSSYVEMELVDTSGEERWFAVTSSYYRDVDGVFLVYDVSDKESFENLPYWINSAKKYITKDCVQMLLVGNKVDLRESKESRDIVSQERGTEFAKLIKFPFVETSATDIDSVMFMCKKMIEILIKANISRIEDVNIQVIEEANRTIKLHSSPKKKVQRKFCKRS